MILDLETGKFEFLEDLENLDKIKSVSLGLSGGTDSVALLYLLCLTIPHAKIVCYCGVENVKPTNEWYVRDIFQIMQEKFPHVNMVLEFFYFNRFDPVIVQRTEEYWNSIKDKSNLSTFNGVAKIIAFKDPCEEINRKHKCQLWFNAMTKNPPISVQKEMGFEHLAEKRRNKKRPIQRAHGAYEPFVNEDKKTIAAIFKKFNLMEDIFPLTQSCNNNHKNTEYFTKPCGNCYWCYEKLWAFGTMDIC